MRLRTPSNLQCLLRIHPRTLSTDWSLSVPLLLTKAQPLIKGIRVTGNRLRIGNLAEAALELASGSQGPQRSVGPSPPDSPANSSCCCFNCSCSWRSNCCSCRSTSSGTCTSSRFSMPHSGSSPISTYQQSKQVNKWPAKTPSSLASLTLQPLFPTWMSFSQAICTSGSDSQVCSSRRIRYAPWSRTCCRPGAVAVS